MGATVAPASVVGVVIGVGGGKPGRHSSRPGAVQSILLQENTIDVLARFRHFGWHNLNGLCGLGAGAVTGWQQRAQLAPAVESRSTSQSIPYAKLTRMGRSQTGTVFALIVTLLATVPAAAQTFETLGTRAAGMGGAFVAVADDASAVYWNPAGLALGGSYFSLILDTTQGKAEPDDTPEAGERSASILAFTTLPVGLSYYRLTASTLRPTSDPQAVLLDRLTTHHLGLTLVQSLTDSIAVASTLKWVRGYAASGIVPDGDRDDLLDGAGELPDVDTSKFDADLGVMASFGAFRAGLTVRNVTEPDFSTAGGEAVTLKRQTRAGFSYVGLPGLVVATDVDLERGTGSLGEVRDVAAGAEARLIRRVSVRSGFRFNALGDEPGGHAPVYSLGTSVAAYRQLLVDAQVTLGSHAGDRGWGVAARLVY